MDDFGLCPNCGKPLGEKDGRSRRYLLKSGACSQRCRKEMSLNALREGVEFDAKVKEIQQKNKHDRKCRVCGKPCWPNYFYCNICIPKTEPYYM